MNVIVIICNCTNKCNDNSFNCQVSFPLLLNSEIFSFTKVFNILYPMTLLCFKKSFLEKLTFPFSFSLELLLNLPSVLIQFFMSVSYKMSHFFVLMFAVWGLDTVD